MKTIWKYKLKIDDALPQPLPMPSGAKILAVGLQDNKPVLWAEVETENAEEIRFFSTVGTGQMIHASGVERIYIGTFQIIGSISTLVGHVFELKQ